MGQAGQGAPCVLSLGALCGLSSASAAFLRFVQDFLVEQERKASKRSVSKDDDEAGLVPVSRRMLFTM
jgi:hypothetical protein